MRTSTKYKMGSCAQVFSAQSMESRPPCLAASVWGIRVLQHTKLRVRSLHASCCMRLRKAAIEGRDADMHKGSLTESVCGIGMRLADDGRIDDIDACASSKGRIERRNCEV